MDRLDMDPAAKKGARQAPTRFFQPDLGFRFCTEDSLKYTCDYWQDHNLTVGSDYPRGHPSATWNSKQGTVNMIKEMERKINSDKEKILGANAMRLFRME